MAGRTGRQTATKSGSATKAGARRDAAEHVTKGAARGAANGTGRYTDPALRERLKRQITAGTKGGRAGQWSARKAQLLAHEYEAHGGGYTGAKTEAQQHLDEWTHEGWQTRDGKPARRGATTARYLPKQAWDELTPAEQRATDKKKRSASKAGRQFVANTGRAAAARRDATEHAGGAAKRPATKHTATKHTATKRPPAKQATATRGATKRATAAKRPAATKRPAAKRAMAKQAPAKRAAAKRTARKSR